MDDLKRQEWTGGELLVCALLELLIVRIAYQIDRSKTAPYLSTAAWAIVLGIGRATDIGLDPQILFFGLLPPIILEGGFSTQHRGFFANFWDVFLLGVVGTVGASVVTGALLYWLGRTSLLAIAFTPSEAMLYGALISGIDPIATQLVLRKSHVPTLIPELVFGERSLNNAITVALFNLCEMRVQSGNSEITFANATNLFLELVGVGVGSLVLAAIVGYSSAYLLRRSDELLRQHQAYEISILLLFAYASYLAGEFFHLSGHLAVFFSGAFIRHYHMYSISHASATSFRHLLTTMSFLSENFIFIYLGVSIFAYSGSFEWEWRFILVSFAVCLVARALMTFPLCYVANLWRSHAIPFKYMFVIWYSGLRGAVAFALSLNVKSVSGSNHAAIIRSATIFTVLTTTILFTMATRPLLNVLGLAHTCREHARDRLDWMERRPSENSPLLSANSEHEATWIRDTWNDFDERYLQPHFGGSISPHHSHQQQEQQQKQ
uniref:Sodium/hydrogen exchanger n=1 Tax=Globisporangium ultimum (strain ATCC 200006 / CBS 805.95 / DAOM BR144) TaxID=431595 RepID=K3WWX9_GLOUD